MANAVIYFETEWRQVQTTCGKCCVCEETIYGNQYQLFIMPGGEIDATVCEACHDAITGA